MAVLLSRDAATGTAHPSLVLLHGRVLFPWASYHSTALLLNSSTLALSRNTPHMPPHRPRASGVYAKLQFKSFSILCRRFFSTSAEYRRSAGSGLTTKCAHKDNLKVAFAWLHPNIKFHLIGKIFTPRLIHTRLGCWRRM
jgi:hypothetical protein